MVTSTAALAAMNRGKLEEVFRNGSATRIPTGEATGTALMLPGSRLDGVLARATRLFAWQGKAVDSSGKHLVNRVTPFGLRTVAADVYIGPSRLDGKDAIILDYSKTSLVARMVRDELREVAPATYLGFAYVGGRRTLPFLLTFPDSAEST
jgi:hypothetical protein